MDRTGKIKTFSFVSLDGYVVEGGHLMDGLPEYARPGDGDYGFGVFCGSVSCAVMDGMLYASLLAQDLRLPEMEYHIIAPCDTGHAPGGKPAFIPLRPEEGFGYAEAVGSLRDDTAGDIWLAGGHELVSLLLEGGMIDEITLNVVPVILGHGRPMFSRSKAGQRWNPVHCTRYDNGVVQVRYAVSRPVDGITA